MYYLELNVFALDVIRQALAVIFYLSDFLARSIAFTIASSKKVFSLEHCFLKSFESVKLPDFYM